MRMGRRILAEAQAEVMRAKEESDRTLKAMADELIVLRCQVEELRASMGRLSVAFTEEEEN